jgi:hypothetical protein
MLTWTYKIAGRLLENVSVYEYIIKSDMEQDQKRTLFLVKYSKYRKGILSEVYRP